MVSMLVHAGGAAAARVPIATAAAAGDAARARAALKQPAMSVAGEALGRSWSSCTRLSESRTHTS